MIAGGGFLPLKTWAEVWISKCNNLFWKIGDLWEKAWWTGYSLRTVFLEITCMQKHTTGETAKSAWACEIPEPEEDEEGLWLMEEILFFLQKVPGSNSSMIR